MSYMLPKDLACPYCDFAQDVNRDDLYDLSEDALTEMECRSCEKTFIFSTTVEITHRAHKADCLNGDPHRMARTKTFPEHMAVMRCRDCGHEEPLPKNAT